MNELEIDEQVLYRIIRDDKNNIIWQKVTEDKLLITDFIIIAYIRWSTSEQSDGYSLLIQFNRIIVRAFEEGYVYIKFFIEDAKSAYKIAANKRPKMIELKQFVLNNKNAVAMIFLNESRPTRQIEDFPLEILGPLMTVRPNFKVFSTDFPGIWDQNNPYVQARLTGYHQESEVKAEHSIKYQETMVNDLKVRPGSRSPFGFEKSGIKGDDIAINDYISIVKLSYFLYSYGYSDLDIAKLYNESGIKAPSHLKCKGPVTVEWSDSTIRYILKNRFYIGDLTWFENSDIESVLLKNKHEPLIPIYLWKTVQYLRKCKSPGKRIESVNILTDLLYCKKCLQPLKTKNDTPKNAKKDYCYYVCNTCNCKVNIHDIHSEVLDHFTKRWTNQLLNHVDKAIEILTSWQNALLKNRAKIIEDIQVFNIKMSNLEKANTLYSNWEKALSLQLKKKQEDKKETAFLLEEIDKLKDRSAIKHIFEMFSQNIKDYKNREKRAILLLLIDKIYIDFQKNADLTINYTYTPYVEIKKSVEHITGTMVKDAAF